MGRSIAISADDGGPVLQGGGDDALVEQVRNTGIESIAVLPASKMPYRSFQHGAATGQDEVRHFLLPEHGLQVDKSVSDILR